MVQCSVHPKNHDNQANITHAEEILREQQVAPLTYTRMGPQGVGGEGGPGNYWVPVRFSLGFLDDNRILFLFSFRSTARKKV